IHLVVDSDAEYVEATVGANRGPRSRQEFAALAGPIRPPAIGYGLPGVPDGAIGAAHEYLETAIGVVNDGERTVVGNLAAERRPIGPGAAARGLPAVPDAVVGAAHEYLETAVGVAADRGLRRGGAAELGPVGPGAAGSVLPGVPDGVVGAASEHF